MTSCWNSHELNQYAFVTSLGFDKGSSGIMVTAQILNPRAIASQKTTNEAPVVVVTKQGKTAYEALRRINVSLPREANGSHMQSIVFGEKFAMSGITEVTDFLLRHPQTSPELYMTVAKGTTANSVLTNLTKLENNPSVKLNSSIQISQKVWAAIKAIKLFELVNCIASDGINPVLTGVTLQNNKKETSLDDLKLTENDSEQLNGNGVFKRDKLVGWLNEKESKGFNFVCGNVHSSVGFIESKESGTITLNISNVVSKRKVIVLNNKPVIKLDIEVKAQIENLSKDFDIIKEANLNKVEKLSDKKLIGMCFSSINKAKKLKSDIFGFGEDIHRSNPTLWKSVKKSWNESGFVKIPVKISARFKIINSNSVTKLFVFKED